MKNEKWKIILLFPLILHAKSFDQLIKLIDNSNLVKIYQKNIQIQKEKFNQAKAKNYGKVDLEYDYSHFFENPTVNFDLVSPVAAENAGTAPLYPLIYKEFDTKMKMGDKNNFIGSLVYSYPLFTGFAITEVINIQKLNVIKSKLELDNIKRNLILKTAKLYAGIYALNKKIEALKEAEISLLSAKAKAEALFKEGLINKSTLDEIDAKCYEINANISKTIAEKKSLLNILSYILNTKINSVSNIPIEKLKNENILNRPDVKMLETALKITQNYIKLVKSNFLPKIYFQAGIKKEATNIGLDKNNYQNVDKSFVALSFQYNLFKGGEDTSKLQEAKLAKLKTFIYFRDYLNKVKTTYKNDLLMLKALKKRLFAAKKEIEARKSYYEYIKAKFEQGLADVTDLNSAIAKLAQSKAKKDYIKSQIFFWTLKTNIDGGD